MANFLRVASARHAKPPPMTPPPASLSAFEPHIDSLSTKMAKASAQRVASKVKKIMEGPSKSELMKTKAAKQRTFYYKNKQYQARKKDHDRKWHQKKKAALESDANANDKEKANAKVRENKRRSRDYQKFAELHNQRYSSAADKVPPTLASKETRLIFGKQTRTYLCGYPRLVTLSQDIVYFKDPLGHCDGGHFAEVTVGSMQLVSGTIWKMAGGSIAASHLHTIDNGSGLGYPSLIFSQCNMEFGLHFGLEMSSGLNNTGRINVKNITEKAMVNVYAGCFEEEQVKLHGELKYVRPPHVVLMEGNIEHTKHYAGVDVIYGFDHVNSFVTKESVRKAWDDPRSWNVKILVTNSSPKECLELGYTDLVLSSQCRIDFKGISESRTAYFYFRETFAKKNPEEWMFEYTNHVTEVDPNLKEVYDVYSEGKGHFINWKLVEWNLKQSTVAHARERKSRKSRNLLAEYNEKKLAKIAASRTLVEKSPKQSMMAMGRDEKPGKSKNLFTKCNKQKPTPMATKPAAIAVAPEGIDFKDTKDDVSYIDSVSFKPIDWTQSEDSDGVESVSFESTEFMRKGMWIAGQENVKMTEANHLYVRYPVTTLGLNVQQVEMCLQEMSYYYNKYVQTIIVKDLHHMIAAGVRGYKEIRQRTPGRYDIQIPTFDMDKFSFLHDSDASWMPLVCKFLANPHVALIHKGIILSMGKSAKQGYHADGIHFHPLEHKPCYAVNVFFYLVDIDEKIGGTEFYEGSHKVCQEDLDQTTGAIRPLVKAGQPIIFDYRLGHLGLENKTKNTRPLLYLTYSGVCSDGQLQFTDEMNFSSSLPSLEEEVGLIPDHPGRDERAIRWANRV
ncbi:hypothetical protein HJC23_000588 [Cyclotella cryptica]|uniref:Fe2OG dioxygenase domain-containing protein n=1 Tax=Cyclotella cryptica TaxID=29204 RepID=A0ABD3PGE5_9STRA|eukprot:CCRYP_015268-RC/>CCRYP_015268-RC protein AED:0.34 eAED:0.34 QI:432/1/1/1/1/1/3/175/842